MVVKMSENKLIILNNKKKVTQSNQLIESPYAQEFSPFELKIFEFSKAYISETDRQKFSTKNNKEYVLTSKQIAEILGTSVSSISHTLENTCKRIIKKGIHLRNIKSDGSVEFEMSNIIPNAKYKDGLFTFELNYKIIPYLLEYKDNFTEYYLHHILELKSSYAMKIYQLLYQYKNLTSINGFKTRKFLLDELKKQFGVANKYTDFSNFRKRILDPSVLQINESTDLEVNYETYKVGNKVFQIEFKFRVKKISDRLEFDKSKSPSEYSLELKELIISVESTLTDKTKSLIEKYIKNKGVDYVLISLKYAIKHAVSNLDSYLVSTLENEHAGVDLIKFELRKKKRAEEKLKMEEESKLKTKKQKEQGKNDLKKLEIEKEFDILDENQKNIYIDYSNALLAKYHNKLTVVFKEDKLVYSIFAVSNGKSYEYGPEKHITNTIGKDVLNLHN